MPARSDEMGRAYRTPADTARLIGAGAALRLAATYATCTNAEVVRMAYDLDGGTALFLSSPLQRRFRDAHAGTQHMMIAPQTHELTGRVLMGLPTDARLL